MIALIAHLVRERDLAAVLVSHDLDTMTPDHGVDVVHHLRDGRIDELSAVSVHP